MVAAPARIPAGSVLSVRLNHSVDTSTAQAGDGFSASLAEPIRAGEDMVLPVGTAVNGRVMAAKASGRLKGRGYLTLALNSIELDGKKYALATSSRTWSTGGHKKRNLALIGGGSGVGALIGGIASGGTGALIGAGAGAAAGTAGAMITGRKQVHLPAETRLQFKLQKTVTIRE